MSKSRANDGQRRLLKLAGSVSDREPVDWDAAVAINPALETTIVGLRALQALAAVHESGGLLVAEAGGGGSATKDVARADLAAAEPPAGLVAWGPLQILESLGHGGFGYVYRAYEPGLEREVALKLWRRRAGKRDAIRQMAEARALARLRHPGLPVVFGVGEHGGWLGMWTELVRGRTVEEMIAAQGPLGAREAALVGVEICRALAAVHDAGLVHRDIKTVNVMREASGRVVLLDFGLAVRANTPLDDHAAGTPPCMAPETLRGERATAASDLYSLGILLYRLVTAAFPYPGVTAQEVAESQAREEKVALRDARDDLPAGFVGIVERALETSPEARYASASEMEQALAAFLDTSGVGHLKPSESRERSPLPQPLTHFVGRRDELAECLEAVRGFRLVTLLGPGGSGKTRLAIRVAEAIGADADARVAFVDLSPMTEAEAIETELRRALGAPIGDRDRLAKSLRARSGLLVLDNCEHVLEPVARRVSDLLTAAPRWQVLATSRAALKVPGERVLSVPPLGLPPQATEPTAAALGSFDAVRLFVERARLVRPDFRLTDENAGAVAEICRRADGLPLAIELAAARARALTAEEIRERMPDPIRVLDRGDFSTSARHKTLETAIRWTYDNLPEAERRLMDSLAVFAGTWSLQAAAYICLDRADELDTLDAITGLIEKSLVTTATPCLGTSRYRYLDTLRAFALDRLRESGRFEELQARHADYFLALAEEAEPRLWGLDQGAWATRLEVDHPNFLAALAWTRGRPEEARDTLRLAGALARFWNIRGHLSVGRHALKAAIANDPADDEPAARARALMGAGILAIYQSDHAAARESCAEALALYRRLGDESGTARTLVALGMVAHDITDYPAALECYRESLSLCRRLGDTRGIGNILNNLGAIAWRQGHWDEALPLHEEAVMHASLAKDEGTRVLSLTNLAFVALHQGHAREAAARLVEALVGVHEHNMMRHAAPILEAAAAVLAGRRESAVAARLYAAADQQRLALGAPMEMAWRKAHQPMLDSVARDLGVERLDAETRAGRVLGPERAIEEARRALQL